MQILNKDPMETYQKQIHQTIQKCNTLIDKHKHKYLTNIKTLASQLNVYIRTHTENRPIRPVINNTQYTISQYHNITISQYQQKFTKPNWITLHIQYKEFTRNCRGISKVTN
jgi:hypothetical protein